MICLKSPKGHILRLDQWSWVGIENYFYIRRQQFQQQQQHDLVQPTDDALMVDDALADVDEDEYH